MSTTSRLNYYIMQESFPPQTPEQLQPQEQERRSATTALTLYVLKRETLAHIEDARPAEQKCINAGDDFAVGGKGADTPIVKEARATCAGCDFKVPCLYDSVILAADGIADDEMVMGGTTPRERKVAEKKVNGALTKHKAEHEVSAAQERDLFIGTLFIELSKNVARK